MCVGWESRCDHLNWRSDHYLNLKIYWQNTEVLFPYRKKRKHEDFFTSFSCECNVLAHILFSILSHSLIYFFLGFFFFVFVLVWFFVCLFVHFLVWFGLVWVFNFFFLVVVGFVLGSLVLVLGGFGSWVFSFLKWSIEKASLNVEEKVIGHHFRHWALKLSCHLNL